MRTRKPNILFFLTVLLLFSCSKKIEIVRIEKTTIEQKIKDVDGSYKLLLPKSIAEGSVSCLTYFDGCVSAHVFQVQELDFIAVEYISPEKAVASAKKIKGYALENWAFDDVSGEPALEKIIKKIGAKKY